jgi:hypothetical protein
MHKCGLLFAVKKAAMRCICTGWLATTTLLAAASSSTGVRNTVGLDWHPTTGQLWFTDASRDQLGDDQPDDELNVLTQVGQHFGFPWCHTLGLGPPAARTLGAASLADPQLNSGQANFSCSSEWSNGGSHGCSSGLSDKPCCRVSCSVLALIM